MATLNAGIYGVDSNAPEIGALVDGVVTVATSTQLVLQTGAWLDSFTGSFFYTNNQLSSGTITGWKQTYNGVTTFEVTGSSVSVSQFLTWIANDDDATAVQTIFSGADTMNGSFSDDIFWGWNGNDRIRGSGGNDSIDGGSGADTLEGGDGQDSVFGGAGDDVISDADGSNYLRGGEGDDSLSGGLGFDDVHGNQGNDTVAGGFGDDWVVGGQGDDLQQGGDGWDIVYGNLGRDTLNGDSGSDWVRGGQQSDKLNGGFGDDWLSGDRDNDTMTGGFGADTFNLFNGSGDDRITDFSLMEGDLIRWEGGSPSNLTMSQVGANTVITYDFSNSVTLEGVQMSSLAGKTWWIVG